MDTDLHELTAAYALDALDEDERREYEDHLARCERCREDISRFSDTAGALAYAVETPAPSPALRERILDEARRERRVVVPMRRPRIVMSAAAGIAAAIAIGIGIWAASLSGELDRTRTALDVLADPAARSLELEGAAGRLVVGEDGRAALVVRGLEPAPAGKTYEIWVIEDRPRPAGLFDEPGEVVLLDRRVPEDATVAVTVEDDGGVDAPTSQPVFSAQT
jgi:anti-sigma-K factor RskA